MRVGVDGELLGQLIKAHGGVRAFIDHWNASAEDADDHPDNSTVYRWIKGETLPKSGELFLRLAAFLDTDPFALITVRDGDILAAADELLRIVQHSSTAPSWLRFVHGFFGRQISWPPEEIASVYFNRSWHLQEFNHAATSQTNFYTTVVLREAVGFEGRPQVFHFAYRHPTLFHARWLQYGLVCVRGPLVHLHHIGGHNDQLRRSTPDDPIRIETWFGQGPALFRVASLHPFSLSIDAFASSTPKVLRFPA